MKATRITSCRLCGGKLHEVLRLTPTPPANAFVREDQLGVVQECYPLNVVLCVACGCAQLEHTLDPSELFSNYVYVSGTSKSFVEHFERAAASLIERYGLQRNDLVVDIGSNDGTGLKPYLKAGMRVHGFDPAESIAQTARAAGIDTAAHFFTPELAQALIDARGKAQLVTANNVFAHASDLASILKGVKSLLATDGAFVFEVQYVRDLLECNLVDLVYHEHLYYHAVKPLQRFLERNGFALVHVEHIATHGGSIRVHARPAWGGSGVDASVGDLIREEDRRRLFSFTTWETFGDKLMEERKRLLAELDRFEEIAAYGAPAKLTTLLYHFGLNDYPAYVVDDSPLKQGLYTPGRHIAVKPPDVLYADSPECVLVTAWNFSREIRRKCEPLLPRTHFVVPFERNP